MFHSYQQRNCSEKNLFSQFSGLQAPQQRCFSSSTGEKNHFHPCDPCLPSKFLNMTGKLMTTVNHFDKKHPQQFSSVNSRSNSPKYFLDNLHSKMPYETTILATDTFIVGGFVGSKSHSFNSTRRGREFSIGDFILEKISDYLSEVHKRVEENNFNYSDSATKMDTEDHATLKTTATTSSHPLPLIIQTQHESEDETEYEYSSSEEDDDEEEDTDTTTFVKPEDKSLHVPTPNVHARRRLFRLSECSEDSEDSFVVFDRTNDDDTVIFEDLSDSSSDEDTDEIDCCPLSYEWLTTDYLVGSRIAAANQVWDSFYPPSLIPNKVTNSNSKKVKFAEGKPQIRRIIAWDFAHRAARRGHWQLLGIDTERFKAKIQQISVVINPILSQQHRDRIFTDRFKT